MNERPQAVCFPGDDTQFAEHVQLVFESSLAEPAFAAAVVALLRETYPLAAISRRHELAALDGRQVWYAYRDGRGAPPIDRDDA